MKITVHLVVCDDDGHEGTVTEVGYGRDTWNFPFMDNFFILRLPWKNK